MFFIKFVGLLIVTQLSGTGAQVVMSHIPGMVPYHNAIIAYNDGSRIGGDWQEIGSFTAPDGEKFNYVNVDAENVTFNGPNDKFVNAIGDMPHLSCCCPEMKGMLPEYGNKDQSAATKASAQFILNKGIYTSFIETSNSVATLLALANDAAVDLTVEGAVPGTSTKRTIVLKPGAKLIVANTPIAALEGGHVPDTHNDFQAFYNTGVTSAACRLMPSDGPPCAPRADPCSTTASKKSARAKLTETHKALIEKARHWSGRTAMITDVNCSSSQWP